ncbi:hypothetical protein FEI13_18565 [Halomonas urmiana]|uniref:Uncharacterized protein n=1 Tax=Halomonas urmiana TaxID=490901 RepID=A0A5R8M691_9GAMM|nr:hypothetical protein [Halomonas urmiana]TLF45076.1 hypothetical protein FEI13_18565 [Halomonas urmiana]
MNSKLPINLQDLLFSDSSAGQGQTETTIRRARSGAQSGAQSDMVLQALLHKAFSGELTARKAEATVEEATA